MRFGRWLLLGCVLSLAALAAIAVIVHKLDARALVSSMAAKVKESTGRELTIADAKITIFPRPMIVLTDVRFANADWGSQPWLAQAKRVAAAIDLGRLLAGNVRIKYIELEEAHLLLETNGDGIGNWTMPRTASNPPSLEALEVDEFAIDMLAFTYRNGATAEVTQANIDSIDITAADKSGVIEVTARAKISDKQIKAAGTIGTLARLFANQRSYPIDIEGTIGVAAVGIHGTLEEPRELRGIDLKLSAQIPEFADYIAQTGARVPPLGPFRGETRLTGTADAPVFSAIDIELGTPERMKVAIRGELTGALNPAGLYEWQSAGLDFDLRGAQFGDLGLWIGRILPAWGQYRIVGRASGAATAPGVHAIDAVFGGGERPEIRFRGTVANLRAASGIDMQISASAREWWRSVLIADAPPLPPFKASARVRDTRKGYRVDNLELKIADSAVSATLDVIASGPRLHISGKASAPQIDLSRLAPAKGNKNASAAATGSRREADRWKLADVDLDLKIGRLVFPDGRQLQSGSGRLALDDGRLKATALQATLGGANIKLDGTVAEPQNVAGLDLRIALQGGELADLFKFFGKKLAPVGPFQGHAQLNGSLDALNLTAIDATVGKAGQNLRAVGQIEDALKWRGVKLAITANVSDSIAAGRLFDADVPRLPALRATANVTGPQNGYIFDDLKLVLGRTSVQGRVAFVPGEPRPRVTANLSGTLVDLSELPSVHPKADDANPLLAADVEADVRFDRVVLPDRQALGPMSGTARLTAGALQLKQFVVGVDGASATLDGKINDPLKPAGIEVMVNAKVTRGAGLAAFTGLSLKDLPAFTASGKLTDVPNGYALAGLKFAGAATTLAGDIAITRGAKRFKVTAKTTSPLVDLSGFMQPAEAGVKKPAAGTRTIPDVPLPLDVLRVIDADLDLRFDTVKFGDAPPLGLLLVRAVIADGILKAAPVQLTAQPGQTLSVSGTVDANQSAWALQVDGKGIDFGAMLTRFGRPGVVTGGVTDLALQLDGRGKSLAAILGSLNGNAQLKVGPYRIHNFAVPLGSGVIMHMFGLANPFLKADPDTDVKCLTARVPIKNGILNSERRVATETTKYNAIMSGTINLRTEALDLSVTPVVNGEVTTVVRLSGTLAAPVVSVNAVGAIAKSAVSFGATVATLGGWWVADTLIKKTASDPSPCTTALVP